VMTSRGHTWNRWYGGPTISTNALAAERDSIGRVPVVRASTAPVEIDEPTREEDVTPDQPWIVIVWNDPINLMTYVVYVFQKLFGYSREKATSLMLDVHHKGRAVVSNGTRERAELDVFRLHEHGLWATLQQDK
jgi:ATP-dependent Clp protease adaptor protein ClpS